MPLFELVKTFSQTREVGPDVLPLVKLNVQQILGWNDVRLEDSELYGIVVEEVTEAKLREGSTQLNGLNILQLLILVQKNIDNKPWLDSLFSRRALENFDLGSFENHLKNLKRKLSAEDMKHFERAVNYIRTL